MVGTSRGRYQVKGATKEKNWSLSPKTEVAVFGRLKGFEFRRLERMKQSMKVCDSQSGQVDLSTLPQQPAYMNAKG